MMIQAWRATPSGVAFVCGVGKKFFRLTAEFATGLLIVVMTLAVCRMSDSEYLCATKTEYMTTAEKFNALKERELKAKTNAEFAAITADMERLADEDPEGFERAFLDSARRTLEDARQLGRKGMKRGQG